MRLLIITLLSLSLTSSVFSFGKKPPKNRLTFHMQGQASDGPKMVFPQRIPQLEGRQLFFKKSPLTFTKEIVAFLPSFAEDGTARATFQFRPETARRIAAITNQNRQKWLAARLNGRFVGAVFIENPVTDGKLSIWQGMKQAEIVSFDYIIPRIGESGKEWKERLENHKKARAAEIKARKEKQRK